MAEHIQLTRRDVLRNSLVGASAMAGLGGAARAAAKPEAKTEARLKLCSQERRVPGKSFQEKIKNLEKWGALGIELHGNPGSKVGEIQKVLADSKISVSALCWGSAGGKLVSLDKAKRREGIDALKAALDTAGALKANGVIFVPCFHKQSTLKPDALDKIMLEILPGLGDHAVKVGTKVLLEPLRSGETFYINRLEQAVAICKQVKHPGVAMMGDFYHMTREEKSEPKAFECAGDLLRHVHIASRKTRKLPGTDQDNYVDGLRGLKKIGYQQYISLECGINKGQNAEQAVPACFDLLRKQWAEATI
jgi:sugar phosphate isomerase/epimerase